MIGECDQGEQDLKEWVGSVKVVDFLLPMLNLLFCFTDIRLQFEENLLYLPFH